LKPHDVPPLPQLRRASTSASPPHHNLHREPAKTLNTAPNAAWLPRSLPLLILPSLLLGWLSLAPKWRLSNPLPFDEGRPIAIALSSGTEDSWAEEVDPTVLATLDDEDVFDDQGVSEEPGPPVALFTELLGGAGIKGPLELRPLPAIGGFGLFVSGPQPAGAVLLAVPKAMCLLEPVALPVPRNASVPVTVPWDFRLLQRLLNAIETDGFWSQYANLFPDPQMMGHPLLLPPEAVKGVQHRAVATAVVREQARLWGAYPKERPDPKQPEGSWPPLSLWALALTRSRALEAGDDYALVPFLDMANHSETPNAIWNFEDGVFKLVALTPIAVEEEVVICYHEKMDNRRTYMQYGFVSIGGNRNDRIPGMDKVKEQGEYFLSRPRLWQYLSSRGMQPDDPDALMPAMVATVRSLPLRETPDSPSAEEAAAADALRGAVEDFAASEFTSSMEDDIRQAEELMENGLGNAIILNALTYAVERKALFQTAVDLLEEYALWLREGTGAPDPLRDSNGSAP